MGANSRKLNSPLMEREPWRMRANILQRACSVPSTVLSAFPGINWLNPYNNLLKAVLFLSVFQVKN